MLDAGVSVDNRYKNDLTLLMWAAGYGQLDVVKTLLAAGADPQLKDNREMTAQAIATQEGFTEIARLIEAGSQ